MPFKKGISGNPNGRKAGSPNKITKEVRTALKDFIETNTDNLQVLFDELDAKQKLQFYADLLPYVVPKLNANSHSIINQDMPHVIIVGVTPDDNRGAEIPEFPSNFSDDELL
jgi:hypothetical protein